MLKKRLIPKLLIKNLKNNKNNKNLVFFTSENFKKFRIVGNPVSQAKIYQAQKADELIIFFCDKKINLKNSENIELIKKFSTEIFMPLTIGGGVKSVSDFELLLENGADKVSINSIIFERSIIISEAAKKFGSQCVVVSIDFIQKKDQIFIYNNKKKSFLRVDLLSYIKKIVDFGAGELVLTDINRDGKNSGLNIEVARLISENVKIPIIISGGCSSVEDFIKCFKQTEVQGISAGNFFSFKDQNPLQTRSQISNAGINIRI
jgi:cyclase